MTKINVNIRLDANLKKQAQILADKMWTNLSTVINMYLIKFVESWNLEYRKDFSEEEIKEVENKTKTEIKKDKNEENINKTIKKNNDSNNNSFLSAMI